MTFRLRDITVCLLTSLPPIGSEPDIRTKSPTIGDAIKRLDNEASLLMNEVRSERVLHHTLHQVAERMR